MDAQDATGGQPTRRGYALTLLTLAYLLNYFDRSIVNVLLGAIKADLKLSDTALGFIAGLGFALLYTLLGIPLARLADRKGRRPVIAFGVGLWSLMTALGGLAQSGTQLALARTGVGIGEAAGTAPSIAMIAGFFGKDERPRALSILNTGIPLGIFLGILFGGVASQWIGWRGALFVAGVPGLIVAALLQFTVREPRAMRAAAGGGEVAGVGATLRFLVGQRSYLFCLGGSFFSGFALNALFVWSPTFFARIYAMRPAEVGAWVGGTLGLAGALGAYAGGAIVSRFGGTDDRWKPAEPALACLLALPFLMTMLLVRDRGIALACLASGSFLMLSLLGPLYSVYQCVVCVHMRSFATAIHNLVGTLGGLGLGALIVGIASDHLTPTYGSEAIRYALLLPIGCLLPAAALYGLAIRTVRIDATLAEARS